jgi:hypothetical protein
VTTITMAKTMKASGADQQRDDPDDHAGDRERDSANHAK